MKYRKILPADYHCGCRYCVTKFVAEIVNDDGSWPSKFERNKDYPDLGSQNNGKEVGGKLPGHLAKTPLHLAKACVDLFSKPGDWVYDPTMGSGTSGVEALRAGRKAVGVELDPEHFKVARRNMRAFAEDPDGMVLLKGDAREVEIEQKISLIINNPPYIGDRNKPPSATGVSAYRELEGQIGLMKEGPAYYDAVMDLYAPAIPRLKRGGHLCIGVKDMMRNKEPYLLHYFLTRAVEKRFPDMKCVQVLLLRHHPMTGTMLAYKKRFGIDLPLYQTITVLQKQ